MSDRGGYRCSFKGCQSASSEKRGIKETLFRFPKDEERSKLWVLACNRKELLSKTATQLYNGYRVCKLHFANNMFLNYEKTRLQPHAVPSFVVKNNDEESNSNSLNVEIKCINASNIENIKEENITIDMLNERDLDNTHIDMPNVSEVGIQTSLSLSSTSSRKVSLYQQIIRAYKRKIANLEVQLHEAKRAKEDIDTLDALLDKYFPQQTSKFLKTQARRKTQKDAKGK